MIEMSTKFSRLTKKVHERTYQPSRTIEVYIGSTGRFKERFSKHDTRAASAVSIVAKNLKMNKEWICKKEI